MGRCRELRAKADWPLSREEAGARRQVSTRVFTRGREPPDAGWPSYSGHRRQIESNFYRHRSTARRADVVPRPSAVRHLSWTCIAWGVTRVMDAMNFARRSFDGTYRCRSTTLAATGTLFVSRSICLPPVSRVAKKSSSCSWSGPRPRVAGGEVTEKFCWIRIEI